jgi:hypothetical protein
VLAAAGSLVVILMLVSPQVRAIPGSTLIWLVCSVLMIGCCMGLVADAPRMFIWMSLVLLVVRITFDFVVLPIRAINYQENVCREDCRRLIDNHPQQKFYVYGKTQTQNVAKFYLAAYSNQVIRITDKADDPSALYLVDRNIHDDFPGLQVDSVKLERSQVLAVMKINNTVN